MQNTSRICTSPSPPSRLKPGPTAQRHIFSVDSHSRTALAPWQSGLMRMTRNHFSSEAHVRIMPASLFFLLLSPAKAMAVFLYQLAARKDFGRRFRDTKPYQASQLRYHTNDSFSFASADVMVEFLYQSTARVCLRYSSMLLIRVGGSQTV